MNNFDVILSNNKVSLKDVKTDSREVKKGDIYVAIHGFNVDHSKFITDAVNSGASLIVTDIDCDNSIPFIKVDDIDKSLTEICKKIYNYNNELQLIGVTGTDGKTTTSTIINMLFNNFFSSAYIGTNGIEFKNKVIKTENTTPKKEELYKYFSKLVKDDCKNVVMEVSSEALLHNRVDSFLFKYVIITNITEDHLNIHKTLDSYINSKLKLINYLEDNGIIIINKDDDVCKKIKSDKHKIYTYGIDESSDFQIKDIKFERKITSFTILHNKKEYKIESPYPFLYNIYNLTAAFIVCYLEGLNVKKVIKHIKKLKPVLGRGEYLDFKQNYNIILDYAHTENGIKNLIENVKKYNQRIIVVTGSAGGR